MYQDSINFLKFLNKKPTVKEWNKLAKENNLLSNVSLRRLSSCSLSALYTKLKQEQKMP